VKLRAARVGSYALRFARPMRTARGDYAERSGAILELTDADGVCGYGESAPWAGFGTETVGDSLAALQRAVTLLHNADLAPGEWPREIATLLDRTPAARAALDGALCDLAARRAGQPVAELLALRAGLVRGERHGERRGESPTESPGETHRAVLRHVPVNALLRERTPDALRREAEGVRRQGYRAAKLKLGMDPPALDIERVRAAREGVGAALALRVDANGAWDESQARGALAALAEFQLEYVEQPLSAESAGVVEALARLRRDASVPIAVDESVTTPDGLRRVLESGAADVVVLKPAALGGPMRALELAARARLAGCRVVFTHAFESAVGACHAVHCAAAWGDAQAVHGVATAGLFEQDLADPPASPAGRVAVSQGPGLGITPGAALFATSPAA
jgi:o-succinylbenzoate synthase